MQIETKLKIDEAMAKKRSGKTKVGSGAWRTSISQLLDDRINKTDQPEKKVFKTASNNNKTSKNAKNKDTNKKILITNDNDNNEYNETNHTTLLKQFDHIINEFNQRSSKSSPKDEIVKVIKPNNNKNSISEAKNKSLKRSNIQTEEETEFEDLIPSKRKLRKLSKPSLLSLKETVTHPEIIEWFDCDAKDPFLLATIKSTKNVVPIPKHWQFKREYLSGRSLLNKKPFELPDIIKQTDISQMRETLPSDNNNLDEQNEKSIKELSRARVQPKLGSLDIDFKKMFNIFFKLGATWKPNLLLPFGDQFFENRNLIEEASWVEMTQVYKPGKISQELRNIMGLQDGQLPIWCMEMNKIGLPPSYPNIKIAGINWDISNLTNEKYGIWNSPMEKVKKKGRTGLFGKILNFVNDNDKFESDNESEQEDEQSIESNEEQENEKELITEYAIENETVNTNPDENIETDKKLYTVLEETKNTENQSTIGYQKAYSMNEHSGQDNQYNDTSKDNSTKQEEEDDGLQNFKF